MLVFAREVTYDGTQAIQGNTVQPNHPLHGIH